MLSILDPSSFDSLSQVELQTQEDAAKRQTEAAKSLTSAFFDEGGFPASYTGIRGDC